MKRPRVVVLGGGISGRLVKFVYPEATVLERNPETKATNLTRMWGTNYLWEPLEGIPCHDFPVVTYVDGRPGTERSISRYKRKIGKPEDVGNWGLQFEPETTGWDFDKIPDVKVQYECDVKRIDLEARTLTIWHGQSQQVIPYDVLVSTIPLNILCNLAHLHHLPYETMFKSSPIYIQVEPMPSIFERARHGMLYVNYCSDPTLAQYRYCDRDGLRHTEYLRKPERFAVCVQPGKIRYSALVDPLLAHLRERGVEFFGRFAKWEPNELVHETYKNIRRWACRMS